MEEGGEEKYNAHIEQKGTGCTQQDLKNKFAYKELHTNIERFGWKLSLKLKMAPWTELLFHLHGIITAGFTNKSECYDPYW